MAAPQIGIGRAARCEAAGLIVLDRPAFIWPGFSGPITAVVDNLRVLAARMSSSVLATAGGTRGGGFGLPASADRGLQKHRGDVCAERRARTGPSRQAKKGSEARSNGQVLSGHKGKKGPALGRPAQTLTGLSRP